MSNDITEPRRGGRSRKQADKFEPQGKLSAPLCLPSADDQERRREKEKLLMRTKRYVALRWTELMIRVKVIASPEVRMMTIIDLLLRLNERQMGRRRESRLLLPRPNDHERR
jgi:hypothetical protein